MRCLSLLLYVPSILFKGYIEEIVVHSKPNQYDPFGAKLNKPMLCMLRNAPCWGLESRIYHGYVGKILFIHPTLVICGIQRFAKDAPPAMPVEDDHQNFASLPPPTQIYYTTTAYTSGRRDQDRPFDFRALIMISSTIFSTGEVMHTLVDHRRDKLENTKKGERRRSTYQQPAQLKEI